MSTALEIFGFERAPFADELPAADMIGTRSLRRVVSRIQAALRDGYAQVAVVGAPGIGKTCLANALPSLFAGSTRVALLPEPGVEWPAIRPALARQWQLPGDKLSRNGILEAARSHRLVLVVDRAESARDAIIGHLEALQAIQDEDGSPVVTVILFLRPTREDGELPADLLAWIERCHSARIEFEPLAPDAVSDYIERRLRRAGHRGAALFTPRATLAIHAETGGVPREISRVCSELIGEAAVRRMRSIDEPFVRSRRASVAELATLARRPDEEAWDDADHHPRETDGSELVLEEAAARRRPPDAMPRGPASPAVGRDEAIGDPELEAYLSAPPTAAELRAIRGGFLRRNGRSLLLATAAVVVGGLLLAWLLPGGDRIGADPAGPLQGSNVANAPPTSGGDLEIAPGLPAAEAEAASGVVLGRVRGPIAGTARAGAAPESPARRVLQGTRSHSMNAGASPLRSSSDLAEQDLWARQPESLPFEDGADSDSPDLRPVDLPPAAPAGSDLESF